MQENLQENEYLFSIDRAVEKMIQIESMVEMSLKNQSRIIAKLEGLDYEEVKTKVFEDQKAIENKIFDYLRKA